jgi:hypothetical protein
MTKALAVGVGMAMLLPALASAVVLEGHFSGNADHAGPAPGVYANGLAYNAYATLNTTQVNPWYPWDQVNYEYTAVIHAVVVTYNGMYPWVAGVNGVETADFNVATVEIYEDAGTAADYANPSTFTDGTKVLSGVVQNMIGEHVVYWPNPFYMVELPWTITGVVVMTGGTGLANLDTQCAGGLVMNDFVNFQIGTFPAGYEEAYDIEWKCPEVSTSVEPSSWGRMKGLYR